MSGEWFEEMGIPLIRSPYVSKGWFLILPCREEVWKNLGVLDALLTFAADDGGSPAAEASRIVHDGLAAEIAWLRAAGHDVPTYGQRQDRQQAVAMASFRAAERVALTIHNPDRSPL